MTSAVNPYIRTCVLFRILSQVRTSGWPALLLQSPSPEVLHNPNLPCERHCIFACFEHNLSLYFPLTLTRCPRYDSHGFEALLEYSPSMSTTPMVYRKNPTLPSHACGQPFSPQYRTTSTRLEMIRDGRGSGVRQCCDNIG